MKLQFYIPYFKVLFLLVSLHLLDILAHLPPLLLLRLANKIIPQAMATPKRPIDAAYRTTGVAKDKSKKKSLIYTTQVTYRKKK